MTRLTLFLLLVLALALPASLAAAAPDSSANASPPAAAAPSGDETGPLVALVSPDLPSAQAQEPRPQDGFQGCPFQNVFSFSAPLDACANLGAGCDPLCAEQGGTLIAGVTSTGADCTCICCRI